MYYKNYKVISCLFIALLSQNSYAQKEQNKNLKKISLEIEIDPANYSKFFENKYETLGGSTSDSLELQSAPLQFTGLGADWFTEKKNIVNNRVKFECYSDKQVQIRFPFSLRPKMFEPGDSLFLKLIDTGRVYPKLLFTGRGAAALNLQYQLEQREFLPTPTLSYGSFDSTEDYLKWKDFLSQRLKDDLALIEAYKREIPGQSYHFIKNHTIRELELIRVMAFGFYFSFLGRGGKEYDPSFTTSRTAEYDAYLKNSAWDKWLKDNFESSGDVEEGYFYNMSWNKMLRKFDYDASNSHINSDSKMLLQHYNLIKQEYTGLLKMRLLRYIIYKELIKDLGYKHPLVPQLLKDYYSLPGYPEYKKWMQDYEVIAAKKYNFSGEGWKADVPPNFKLVDDKGNYFTRDSFRGKITLLNFWSDIIKPNQKVELAKIQAAFKDDPNIAIVNISADGSRLGGINLSAGTKGKENSVFIDYEITAFPTLYLLDERSRTIRTGQIETGKREGWITLIRKLRSSLNDGPYVSYSGDKVLVNYIVQQNGATAVKTENKVKSKDALIVQAGTDQYPKTYELALQSKLGTAPTVTESASKQLVLSDIEGNFDAFRKLLQANGIIDEKYNWTFGKAHLVFVGDMFDRGSQVTECLWLIYSLEEKARKAGGDVHFVLGNHDLMNLYGRDKYVVNKYKENAKLIGTEYSRLYGSDTELGRWLRTKNIMEKVGDILYTHAGISREVNNLPLTLQEMNEKVRPHYDNRAVIEGSKNAPDLSVLTGGNTSPFWCREYYQGKGQEQIIDSTLQKFNVKHIVTGHTIVGDTVSMHYGGKVFNTDTHHASGKSEALLIEGGRFYRVNAEGKRRLLYVDDKRKISGK